MEELGTLATADDFLASRLTVHGYDSRVVDLAMSVPMKLSFNTYTSRPSGWLKLECRTVDSATVGYGEGATLPEALFTDDCGPNIAAHVAELSQDLQHIGNASVLELADTVSHHSFQDGGRYPTARLAVEMALLDAAAKAQHLSVQQALQIGSGITEVPYGKSIGGQTAEQIVEQTNQALLQNARKIKLKVAPDIFTEVTSAIRRLRFENPSLDLMVDANGGFDPNDPAQLAMIEQLDNLGLVMIEEPVSRVGDLRGLSAVEALRTRLPDLRTRLCLDDCLTDFATCQTALDEGLADIVNVKPGRIGSFLASLDLVRYAEKHGRAVMVGGMFEATPGRCMTTVLGAFCLERGFKIPGDLSLPQERLAEDLVPADKQLHLTPAGNISLPQGIGWGF